jgi:DAK2 domain fusion protein YloV
MLYRRAVAAVMPDLDRARELGRAALANLEANRARLDDLNVYPVPDGDTGTNLTLTVRAVVEALERSEATSPEELAHELTRAALFGARGNSGVIFSQIVRGFADGLDGDDASSLTRAFRAASDAAYAAVRNPVEGTILTVARELAEEAERPDLQELDPAAFLKRLVLRGEDAVARTPELLDVLRDAGVVDAGAAGLVEIVRGLALGVAGEPLPVAPVATGALALESIHLQLSRYRYCTSFVVEGDALDATSFERELERLGDSLLVVGDASALKIHIHTDDPGLALGLGTSIGVVEGVEIANMHRQTVQREERLSAGAVATGDATVTVVAVAPGRGNRVLFESSGASCVIDGGQTMNPSTAQIVEAIEAASAAEVIVLPNNANVLLSAEQAASLAAKPARVVPSLSIQAGLAAIGRFLPNLSADENERAMLDSIADVSTGEVTRASRDAELDGIVVRKGAWLGLAGDHAVASGNDFDAVAEHVVEHLLDGSHELLTFVTGEEEPELTALVERVSDLHRVEVAVHAGGQPHYPLLIYAE